MNPGIIKLIKVLCSTLLFFHLVACLWFYVAKYNNFKYDTWVFRTGIIDYQDWDQYIKSFYWVLQTVTTIGYGDIGSKTPVEMIICCLLIIFGVGFYSFVIGVLSSVMNDITAARLQDKINALTEFANKTKLPSSTVDRITKFFENNQAIHSDIIDPNLLADLPVAIKSEIMNFTHNEIISKISFLKSIKKNLLWLILPMMKPMRFFEKDCIYKQQEQPGEIIFIYEGDVTLSLDINDKIHGEPIFVSFNKYSPGSYFGDSDIFLKQLRDSSAFCVTDVNTLVIVQEDLQILISKDEELCHYMSTIAFERNSIHIQRMIEALVKQNKVIEFSKKLYPDTGVKRNTSAEYAREFIKKYLESNLKTLTRNEKIVLHALNDEEIHASTLALPEMEIKPPTNEELLKIEKLKLDRENSKYSDSLKKLEDQAKKIQKSTLRIKTNNRVIASRLNDINETARLISQKQSSMEEIVYRLLVRVNKE